MPSGDKDAAAWVEARTGYRFADAALAQAALTHRSASGHHNERLEFLGDALLSFVVAELLYRAHPQADEGILSRARAALVNGAALGELAASLELGQALKLGPGELKSGGFRRRSILADALEALIGAIYLDGGLEAARSVIEQLMGENLRALPPARLLSDAKTRLQEWLQGRELGLPVYALESVHGAPHQQTFRVACSVPALEIRTEGEGASRRAAEQQAAEAALARLGLTPALGG
jgi:ribonuclease-3